MDSIDAGLVQDEMSCDGPETDVEAADSSMEEDLAMLSISGLAESEDEDASYHPYSCSDGEDSVQSDTYASYDDDDADFDTYVDDMDIEDNGLHGSGDGNILLAAESCQVLSLVQMLLSHGTEIDLTDSKVTSCCLHMMSHAMLLSLQVCFE